MEAIGAAALGREEASWPKAGRAGVELLARFAGRRLGPAAASPSQPLSSLISSLLLVEVFDSSRISESWAYVAASKLRRACCAGTSGAATVPWKLARLQREKND